MINIKRIRIQPKEGKMEVKDRKELEEKRREIAGLFGVKPSAISLIYVEDEESITEAETWHHFSQPQYSL